MRLVESAVRLRRNTKYNASTIANAPREAGFQNRIFEVCTIIDPTIAESQAR